MPQNTAEKLEETLQSFRDQIDALDDEIIDLLVRRIGIVGQVGEFKRAHWPGQCPIRAGREAEMVRRIMGKLKDTPIDEAAAAAIWRILIGSSTCVESPLSLSVYAPTKDDACYWLAREYFGPTLPVTRQPHAKRVVGDVMDGKVSVGVLPLPRAGDADPWWVSLMSREPNTPRIFAYIPFVPHASAGKDAPAALAIARISPEPTGDDISLIALDADHHVSQHRLQTLFGKEALKARWIDISSPNAASRRHLVEIRGFVVDGGDTLKSFVADLGESLFNIHYLGAYAAPVTLTPNSN